jgi:integrative and conjugative element protein (TIGR02256 family)
MIKLPPKSSRTYSLEIHSRVLEFLENESSAFPNDETGGVIAGEGNISIGPALITIASGPGPKANQSRFSFQRDTEYCQKLLNAWAVDSMGVTDYLGEWHKHHESNPTLSSTDILTCRRIAVDPNYHVKECLLLIIGRSNRRDSLRAFVVPRSGKVHQIEWRVANEEVQVDCFEIRPKEANVEQ